MKSKKSLSINDIARLSGVSTATVSHVLNRKGRYSEETEKRVREVIEQYGYVSNNAARSLKSSSSHTIGLILPNMSNDFFSSIAVSAEQYCDSMDYSLFICNTDNSPEKELRYFRKLDSMRVDGILVISCMKMIERDILSRDIPVVLIDRTPLNNMDLPYVTSDIYTGIYSATESLIKKGCRHIAFVSSFLATYIPTYRKQPYLDAMHAHQLNADESTIIQLKAGSSLINAETEVYQYLLNHPDMDGLICTSDNQAIGALTALRRANKRVPEDVMVFGFDNQFQSRICTPPLSTIERYPSEIGKQAAEKLLQLIRKEPVEKRTVLQCSVIERESTDR